MHEYWATCSIFDHRRPYFRKALLLFDRVVIPIPTRPIFDASGSKALLKEQEIGALREDALRLERNAAAIAVEWDPDVFSLWLQGEGSGVGGGLAARVNRGNSQDTRLQMVQLAPSLKPLDVTDVTAVPVYNSRSSYESATQSLMPTQGPQSLLNLEITNMIPVPPDDVDLYDILRVRDKPGFRDSL